MRMVKNINRIQIHYYLCRFVINIPKKPKTNYYLSEKEKKLKEKSKSSKTKLDLRYRFKDIQRFADAKRHFPLVLLLVAI